MSTTEESRRQWIAVEFEVDVEHEDLACWLMLQLGANGSEIKPLADAHSLIHSVFDPAELPEGKLEAVNAALDEYGLASCLATLRVSSIVEDDWLAKWKRGFEPFAVGQKFLICPPWAEEELTPLQIGSRHVIIIEPGMAFGTGLHATTKFCLRALDIMPAGLSVIDVGTGSGILSIAYALISPQSKIMAVDIDPIAIEVAKENLRLNNTSDCVSLKCGSIDDVSGSPFDLILSNMTCEDIVALLPHYLELTNPGAYVVCAGVLKEKLPILEAELENYPFSTYKQEFDGQWVGVILRKTDG